MVRHPLRHIVLYSIAGYVINRWVGLHGGWGKLWRRTRRTLFRRQGSLRVGK
jgi:hypothetical protein